MSLPVAILAGGLAIRLRPITEDIPKALISVAGRPFAEHQIELLREQGLIRGARQPIRVLARGDIAKKLTVRAHKFSGRAAEKIAAAGGATEVVTGA